jgi:hypothetical protein
MDEIGFLNICNKNRWNSFPVGTHAINGLIGSRLVQTSKLEKRQNETVHQVHPVESQVTDDFCSILPEVIRGGKSHSLWQILISTEWLQFFVFSISFTFQGGSRGPVHLYLHISLYEGLILPTQQPQWPRNVSDFSFSSYIRLGSGSAVHSQSLSTIHPQNLICRK